MSITPIIVNYHTAAFLPPLLGDLAGHEKIETICIVDNSGEITHRFLQTALPREAAGPHVPKINLITPGRNIGFAAGVNLAADQSRSDYILLINPDCRLTAGSIDHLLNACQQYRAVVAGPRFFWDDARQFMLPPSQGTASWMEYALAVSDISQVDHNLLSFYWQMRHERFWSQKTPFAEPFLSGACLLIDRAWACEAGRTVLDDRFFLYYEDNDVCVRAVNDGCPPLCVPDAHVVHYYNQAAEPDETKAGLMAESLEKYRNKYYPHVIWHLENTGDRLADPVPETAGNLFSWEPFVPGGRLFFEFGVNMHFVPFAQARIFSVTASGTAPGTTTVTASGWPGQFVFPADIWDRLADGTYYSRLRDDIKGTIKLWKWQKKTA